MLLAGLEAGLARAEMGIGDALRTTRFLRGRAEFEARPDDVYVVTYPRSGTTWVQFILYLLRSDRAVDFDHLSQVSPWWERSLALGSRRASDFEALESPRVFKSHLPRRWLPAEGRFIYVVRDGLDVALSYWNLYRSHLGFGGDLDAFLERFLKGDLQYGSWFKHVEGWQCFRADPSVLWLEYEAISQDLEGVARQLGAFLGWPIEEGALLDVLEKASFRFMKANENRFDPITETLLDQGLYPGRFLREGRVGLGMGAIRPSWRERFEVARSKSLSRPDLERRIHLFLH